MMQANCSNPWQQHVCLVFCLFFSFLLTFLPFFFYPFYFNHSASVVIALYPVTQQTRRAGFNQLWPGYSSGLSRPVRHSIQLSLVLLSTCHATLNQRIDEFSVDKRCPATVYLWAARVSLPVRLCYLESGNTVHPHLVKSSSGLRINRSDNVTWCARRVRVDGRVSEWMDHLFGNVTSE